MGTMEVPVVQIIRVISVLDGGMSATFAVDVGMQFMKMMTFTHSNAFYNKNNTDLNG